MKDRSVDADRLRVEWVARASGTGFTVLDVGRLVGRAAAIDDQALERTADRLLAENVLTSRSSTFCRRDVVAALCEALPPGAPLDRRALEHAADRVLASREVVALAEDIEHETLRTRDGRVLRVAADDRRYTTASLLTLEHRVLAAAEDGRSADRGSVNGDVAAAALERRPTLSEEQRSMVLALTTRGDAIATVAGRAGTGKTVALAAANDAWKLAGVPVFGAAVARRAAHELRDGAGIASRSVAALLGRLDGGAVMPDGCVLVVDEAGMLGTRDMARLVDHVEAARGKPVLVGDDRQLPELEAGGVFRALARRDTAIHLTENRRQVETWERTAVEQLRDGHVEAALAAYRAHDRVHVEPEADAVRERLVEDWLGAPGDAVMVAARRARSRGPQPASSSPASHRWPDRRRRAAHATRHLRGR